MPPSPLQDAVRDHAEASRAWDSAVHDCTIRLLRADHTMPVDRARLLGEDDARHDHADLHDALWRANIAVSVAREVEDRERFETSLMASGTHTDRVTGAIAAMVDDARS